jgi:hypothetical protein
VHAELSKPEYIPSRIGQIIAEVKP